MRTDALAKLDAAHAQIADAFAAMPDAAAQHAKQQAAGPKSDAYNVEHVPHVQTLFAQWKMAADARR